ncbi:MAG: efflux RND transporter permease subunit [Gemmatimonadaceae bacterium]
MMISDFAIKRPLITVVTTVALVVFGLFALAQLKTDEFPEVNPPFVFVGIPYPGASPTTVEREVLNPVEDAIKGISGVKEINGSAFDGFAQVLVEYVFEKNLQEGTQDIRDAISAIRIDLPLEMEEPLLQRFDPTEFPIVQVALVSPAYTPAQLTRIVDPDIVSQLRGVSGVAGVQMFGDVQRELTVELRPEALRAVGVSVTQVVGALRSQNLAVPVGRLTGTLDERTIRLQGRLERPEDFLQLVVAERGGRVIRLGEVANVRDGSEEARSLAMYNGSEAVGLALTKAQGYSTTDVSDRIKAKLAQLQQTLPPGVDFTVVRDAGVRVENSVGDVEMALLEGAMLTVLVVFVFLNSWRSTIITGLALPVSVLAAFIAVWAFGFTLNTMSLLGLSLAIGILIDDAIVVRENIVRHIEMGKDHMRAAKEGTDEIGLAVAATTFSIVAVFVPIGFIYGLAGQWFKPFALTIASSVLVSLFVSFSLDPMLSAYWADPQLEAHERRNPISRVLDRFNTWFNSLAVRYKKVIGWALDHRAAMVGIAVGSFVVALALPATGIIGGAFWPEDDTSEIFVEVKTPPGSNLDYTRVKAEEAARLVRAHPEVLYSYTTLGAATGAVDEAIVYGKLSPRGERETSAEELARALRTEVKQIAGMTSAVTTTDWGGGEKQIQLQVRGADATTLTATAEAIATQVRKAAGAVDVELSTKGQKPEVSIKIDRSLAGAMGVTVGEIAQSLRPAFAGIKTGDWVDPSGETREVTVRLVPQARQRVDDLRQLPIVLSGASTGGPPAIVPLGQLARVEQSIGPAQIDHLDGDVVVTVEANTSGKPVNAVMKDIEQRIDDVPLPPGVTITQGGETEDQAEVFGGIFAALGVAILLMYLILVMQFGSFVDPLAIMVSLPLSLIGVMLALLLTGGTINLMSLIGVMLLAGLVAKNAILLIDFAKWAREREGLSLRDALIQAGAIRLRPIIMTTLALVAGMLPIAIGSGEGAQFRAPLGRAVIGGVITSTFLTLLVIPTFYEILDEWREWLMARFRSSRPADFHPDPGIPPATALKPESYG